METVVHENDILADAGVISEEPIVNNENNDINSPQNMVSVLFSTEEISVSGHQKHSFGMTTPRSNDVLLQFLVKHILP